MKYLKTNVPIILMILFEAAVGILLLVNPEGFTRTIIILFGVILLAIGLTYLMRYMSAKKEEINDPLSLVVAIVALAIGVICTFRSDLIFGLITAVAIIYGVILVIVGACKLHNYHSAKKIGAPVSAINVVSGLIAVILGIVITVYPKNAALSVWQIAGIILLLEAAVDFYAITQVTE